MSRLSGILTSVRLLVALLGALVLVASTPSAAQALTCAPTRPAKLLRIGDAAFVGRLVDARPDRWIFAVDEPVKGGLGGTVEVRRDLLGFFAPRAGEPIGLVLQRDPDGTYAANDCTRMTPAQLRAAAADPDATCWLQRVRSLRFRSPGRLDVALGGLDDPSTTVTVDWGDGARAVRRLRAGAPRRTVVLRHRYQEPGRHRVKVAVSARTLPACGDRVERVRHAPIVVRT
jgi:hypothetical protein